MTHGHLWLGPSLTYLAWLSLWPCPKPAEALHHPGYTPPWRHFSQRLRATCPRPKGLSLGPATVGQLQNGLRPCQHPPKPTFKPGLPIFDASSVCELNVPNHVLFHFCVLLARVAETGFRKGSILIQVRLALPEEKRRNKNNMANMMSEF